MKSMLAIMTTLFFFAPQSVNAEPWPQFRGPDGTGVSTDKQKLPTNIAPDKNVVWQVNVPAGVSSPVVWGGRIYLTGVKGKNQLVTFALSAEDGSQIWEAVAPITGLEKTDKKPKGRLATPTVATDGKHVVSFFGSSGLLCYSDEGKQLWYREMGPFENRRGASSSPIIRDGWVILYQDHEVGSFIEAIDITNGKTVWRTERSLFNRSYGTPTIVENNVGTGATSKEIILVGSGLVTSYDFKTGNPLWFVKGTSAVTNPMPVLGGGQLYIASANPGPKREFQPDFEDLLKQRDKNSDGTLAANELPSGMFTALFTTYDANKNSHLDEAEYEAIQEFMKSCRNGLIAINPIGKGLDRTASNKVWSVTRSTPRTATPLYHDGHLFMVNDGGIFTSLNAKTGEVVKSERLPANGKYFGSPVLGDGKIYMADDRGQVAVVSAKPEWEFLSSAKFGEPIYPTPAIANGRLYVRTESQLYCFGIGVN